MKKFLFSLIMLCGISTKLLSLAMLLMLFATAMPSQAQEDKADGIPFAALEPEVQLHNAVPPADKLEKTDDGIYRIQSPAEYNIFRQIVATGNPYANAVLEKDIVVSSSIGMGDIQFHYRGTFDGNGHTIEMRDLTNNKEEQPWGLFQYTEPGCVIKNLRIKGTIVSKNASHIGTLIGCATGTRIENCISDTDIDYKGNGYVGGLVGISYGESFFENCAYTGKLIAPKATACYGFVGKNVHMVSLKSNYVAAVFGVSETTRTGQFMEVTRENSQTILNNYACHEVTDVSVKHAVDPDNGFAETVQIRGKAEVAVKSVSMKDVTSGLLCYTLNVKGRNGVVWYQDYGFPYPIRRSSGMVAVMTDDSIVSEPYCKNHSYENYICRKCGAIDNKGKIEPLQKRTNVISGKDVTIGYLRYRYNKYKGLDTAELLGFSGDANAVHIPETINIDGEVYRVDYIAKSAFKESNNIKYLYIGKNVNHIMDDAFNGCDKLTSLYIADRLDNGNDAERLWMEENNVKNEPLFYYSPLETLYIGRNIRWNSEWTKTYSPFQYKKYKTILFGPKVTRVGNYWREDPNYGHWYEIFDDGGVESFYFMGDNDCLNRPLLIACAEGLEKATKCYINRTFEERKGYIGKIQMSDFLGESIFNSMKEIVYGPYCKKIIDNSFSRANLAIAEPKYVDFTNAFNLEEIGDYAFDDCDEAYFAGTFDNTKLKRIGDHAFYDCDKLKKIIIPGTVTYIGKEAFKDIDGISLTLSYSDKTLTIGKEAFYDNQDDFASIYLARKLEYKDGCPFKANKFLGTIVIAPEITELPKGLFTNFPKLGALTFAHSDTHLQLKGGFEQIFHFSNGITSIYIDRDIRDYDGKDYCNSWGNTVRSNLHNITINVKKSINIYSNFKALKTVMFGEKVEEVSGRFSNCPALNTVFAMGNIVIGDSVFVDCTSLENVFLMGKELTVGKHAFANDKKIKQVVVGLTKDPEHSNSSSDAFEGEVYKGAKFSCAGDTNNKKVKFETVPWKLFKTREVLYPTNDYEDESLEQQGYFDHARLAHHLDNGKYELLYLPFAMDSYSFGSDAEVYKLDYDYLSHDDNRYNTLDIKFKRQDIDKEKKLSENIYIVNTNHNIESIESHPNLFEQSVIYVMNQREEYQLGSILIVKNEEDKTLGTDDNAYIFQNGAAKHVDNEVSTIPNSVTLYRTDLTSDKELVLNLVDEYSNVLISSKTGLGFSEHLEGYSSFYDADHTYIAPDWCEVYVVTQSDPDGSLALEKIEDRIIMKGQAVLVKSIDGVPANLKEYLSHTTKESIDPLYTDNILRGVSVDTLANELSDEGFVYVLSCNSSYQNTGFYKLSGDRIMPAGKAYIPPYLISSANLAKPCLFTFNDNTGTRIEHTAEAADANHSIYDLMGRSLKQAGFMGIYIINGLKVVVK